MKQMFIVGVVFTLSTTVYAATGVLNIENDDQAVKDGNNKWVYNDSSLTNKLVWSDMSSWAEGTGTGGTGAWQPSPDNDYVMKSHVVRQPSWTPYNFIGKTLKIGDGTASSATLALGRGGSAGVVNFGQNGGGKIIWENGQFANYYGGLNEIYGDVEITAVPKDDAGKSTRFSCGTNQQVPINAEHKKGVSFWFNGAFSGEAGTLVQFQIASYKPEDPWSNCSARASCYCFAGDMTRCHSTLRFRPWTNRDRDVPSQTDADSSHTTGEIRRSVAVFTPTTKSPMPGTIETWGGSAIELRDGAKFTVANLDLAGNDLIATSYDFSSDAQNKGGTLTVSGKYTHQHFGKTLIRLTLSGKDTGAKFSLPVLKAPVGQTLSIDDFEFEQIPTGCPYELSVKNDTDGRSTLFVSHENVIYLTKADAYQAAESFRKGNEGWTNHWSDLQWPRSGYDYYVEKLTLRTPINAMDGSDSVKTNSYKFMGDSLTVVGATINIRTAREIDFGDLRMYPTTDKSPVFSCVYSSPENKDILPPGYDPKGKSGMCILDGHLSYMSNSSRLLKYSLTCSRGFVQQMEIEGSGPIQYDGNIERGDGNVERDVPPGAFFWLRRPNTKLYSPRTLLSSSTKTIWKPTGGDYKGQEIPFPNRDMCCHVYFDSSLCFGGPLKEFSIDGIEIRDYAILEPTQSVSFDDPNKGFRIGNRDAGNSPVAQFVINDGITMTLHSPINFNANNAALEKRGGGILELGEGCYSTFWSGGNPEPSSGASNNLMKVLAGGLKISSTNACDGLQVSMTDDARIILAAHPDNEFLARYGLYNQKYRKGRTDRTVTDPSKEKAIYYGKPLYLEEGAKWLSFVIEKDSDKPPRKLGLLTVGAEYAEEIEKHMRINWSYSGFTVSLQKEIIPAPVHGGELVVFSAIFTPGLIMHVR